MLWLVGLLYLLNGRRSGHGGPYATGHSVVFCNTYDGILDRSYSVCDRRAVPGHPVPFGAHFQGDCDGLLTEALHHPIRTTHLLLSCLARRHL